MCWKRTRDLPEQVNLAQRVELGVGREMRWNRCGVGKWGVDQIWEGAGLVATVPVKFNLPSRAKVHKSVWTCTSNLVQVDP